MGKLAYLFGGVTKVALYGSAEYGWGRKTAISGNFLNGFLGVDDQKMEGSFEPQFYNVLFRRIADDLFEDFLKVKGRIVTYAGQSPQGNLAFEIRKDIRNDMIYPSFAIGGSWITGHGSKVSIIGQIYPVFRLLTELFAAAFTVRKLTVPNKQI